MENKIFKWLVKRGTITILRNGHQVSLNLDYEQSDSCLLTRSDTGDIIQILTSISQQIWNDPHYQRKPYTEQLLKINNGAYCWEVDSTEFGIRYHESEQALEFKCNPNKELHLEINYLVEIIQILEQFCN